MAERVDALRTGDTERFLELTRLSGASSAMYLQNVSVGGTSDQPSMLAIALAEELLAGGWRSGDVILVDAQDGHLTFTRGEGAIPEPSERIHMELPKARSHWTPSGRPASSSDLASAGGE